MGKADKSEKITVINGTSAKIDVYARLAAEVVKRSWLICCHKTTKKRLRLLVFSRKVLLVNFINFTYQ